MQVCGITSATQHRGSSSRGGGGSSGGLSTAVVVTAVVVIIILTAGAGIALFAYRWRAKDNASRAKGYAGLSLSSDDSTDNTPGDDDDLLLDGSLDGDGGTA